MRHSAPTQTGVPWHLPYRLRVTGETDRLQLGRIVKEVLQGVNSKKIYHLTHTRAREWSVGRMYDDCYTLSSRSLLF
jgi:hypothetical protein